MLSKEKLANSEKSKEYEGCTVEDKATPVVHHV
jgi:hypothetical protein